MIGARGPVSPKLFTYMYYDEELTQIGLDRLNVKNVDLTHIRKMDSVDYIDEMQVVGKAIAQQQVKERHFEGFVK